MVSLSSVVSSTPLDHVGRVLDGRYRLLSPVGRGASGVVFRAQDTVLGREVAVKLLHGGLASDAAFLRRFRAEAQAAAGLSHPHVVSVHDWGEDAGEPYLVMDYLGGGSLRVLLDRVGHIGEAQAVSVGIQAAQALAYAHRRGILHRDIKPSNILFGEDGQVRLADFGLAKALSEAAWTEPLGAVVGTVRYAAPELVEGRPGDARSDVYSLGLVLIEAISGKVPFQAETPAGTLMARLGGGPELPDTSEALAEILAQATSRDRASRLDAAELAGALGELAKQLPEPEPLDLAPPQAEDWGEPTRIVPIRPLVAGTAKASPQLEERVESRSVFDIEEVEKTAPALHARRRRRWGRVVVAVVAAAAVGAGALWYSNAGPSWFRRSERYRVPLLAGQSLQVAEAIAAKSEGKFRVRVRAHAYSASVPKGWVLSQSPPPKVLVSLKATVFVVVSSGPAPRAVPDVARLSLRAAEESLRGAGFKAVVAYQYSETIPAGEVISYSPRGVVSFGTRVSLLCSRGPRPRIIPALAGQSVAQVEASLARLDLRVSERGIYDSAVQEGLVVATLPGPGKAVPRGSVVEVEVSLGPPFVRVPDVIGYPEQKAAMMLGQAGLRIGRIYGPDPQGTVVYASPGAGEVVREGTEVTLDTA